MKRTFVLLAMTVVAAALAASISDARKSGRAPRQRTVEPATSHNARGRSDLPLDRRRLNVSAAVDTYVLADYTFDSGGMPELEGWASVDITQSDQFFHVDGTAGAMDGGDFGRLVPLEGNQSLWCGVDAGSADPYCHWGTLPGYGDNWAQRFESDPFLVEGDVTVSYLVAWDTEAGYDFAYLEYDDVNSGWTALRTYDGIGQASESVFIPSADIGDTLRVRFRFQSEAGWSDEDGLWNTDGALIVDSLKISDNTGVIDYQDFEGEAIGALATADGDWHAASPPGFGDYAGLHDGASVLQEDYCVTNFTSLWGFFDDPANTDYSCGGHPEQGAVPYGPSMEGLYLTNEIWSPAIDWNNDIYSTPVPATAGVAVLQFDVYRDLPYQECIFYVWHVRWYADGCWGTWRDRNYVYYGDTKEWASTAQTIGDLAPPGADSLQVALGVVDMCGAWCGTYCLSSLCHSHAPLFDNVTVKRIASTGPVWFVQDIDLFQDNFATDGTTTGTVRVDMAKDILPGISCGILPGDSSVVTVHEPYVGLRTDPYTGGGSAVYTHVAVFPQDQPGKGGSNLESGPRWPWVNSTVGLNNVEWDVFRMDTVVTPGGGVVPNKFCIDLHDGLFTPGDTIFFYFSATDANLNTTYWSQFTGTTDDEADVQAAPMEMTCLPANALNGVTDILYVDDFDQRGAQPYFDSAFEALGITPDRYDVRGPSSCVGNSPGGRVRDVSQQLIPRYRTIIWNSGDLYRGTIGDGYDGSGPEKVDDFAVLYTFLDQHPDTAGVYISGDDVAEEWSTLTGQSAILLQSGYMNFNLLDGDHVNLGVPISPLVVGQPGTMFDDAGTMDSLIVYGDCPGINDFDVFLSAGAPCVAAYLGNPADAAVLAQETINAAGGRSRVVLSGFSYHEIRDVSPRTPATHITHLDHVLEWLETGFACPTHLGIIDFGTLLVGESQDTTFAIKNNTPGPLIGYVSEACDHYSITAGGGSFSLAPDESLLVTVLFEPSTDGLHTCSIETGVNTLCSSIRCTGAATYFVDQTGGPLGDTGNGRGVAWGDYDNDGDLDLYLANSGGANKLFRNEGGGVFADATVGLLGDTGPGVGVAWGDYDNDGDLDLFLANYGFANKLFRNEGGGVFADATSGPLGDTGYGRGVAWGDYDNDGDLDLFVANSDGYDKLLRNEGGGEFMDATSGDLGNANDGSGVAWGDYDNDGDLDLSVTRAHQELFNYSGKNSLFRNDGGGVFVSVASSAFLEKDGVNAYGVAWGDYDNDGDLDLYVAYSGGANSLFRNDGDGVFVDVTCGPLGDTGNGRGVAWGDYDNDGDLDLYLANSGGANKLFRNDQATGSHWLHINLIGRVSNASAIGARVRAVAGGLSQIREVSGGSGYLSQNSLTVEFGLGAATVVDTLEIRWPVGIVQDTLLVAADQIITIEEPLLPACHIYPTSLDFDSVLVGSFKDTTFTITNSGVDTLRGSVSAPCSHYSILSGSEPYSLGHEESLTVTVRFEPTVGGSFFCSIETGDAICSDISCTGVGVIPPVCSVLPDNIDFGTVLVGSSEVDSFTIKNTGGGTLDGTVSESCGYYDIISGGEPYSLAADESLVVTVQFEPTVAGTLACSIETGDTLCGDVSCTGVGVIPPVCSVLPESIDFGTVLVGSSGVDSFTIKNTGGGTLGGTVSESCDYYDIVSGGAPYSLAADESLVVTVRFEPTVAGTLACSIETGDTLCSDVSCTGFGQGPICLVEPSSLDFDSVFVGSWKDTTLIISNAGGDTLRGTLTAPCSHYSIVSGGDPYNLGYEDSLTVTVRFEPAAAGTHVCTVETGDALCSDVSCTGSGENPPACLVEPAGLDFDSVFVGSWKDTTFFITNTGDGRLTGSVSEACSHYSIQSGGGAYSLAAAETLVVGVRFGPTAEGTHECSIETGDTLCGDVSCTGFGEPLPACLVTPPTLDFGAVAVGNTKDLSFTVKNTGGGSLAGEVSESCAYYNIISGGGPYSLAAAESLVVTVRFAPTESGIFPCTIETEDALCSDVEATGAGVGPMFVVSPSTIDFGRTAEGTVHDTTFVVKNVGHGAVVGNVSEACSYYSIESGGGPFSLSEDESLLVDIRYAPTVYGLHECLIETNTGVCNGLAFVADLSSGLQIIDVGNPSAPVLAAYYDTPALAWGVYLSRDHVYIADDVSGLQVIDIRNPAAPVLVGTYDTPGKAWGVCVAGDHAFVADFDAGLQAIYVGNPTTPTLSGSYDTPGYAWAVYISGEYAFVADDQQGLQVIDVSDPAAPTLAGSYNTPGGARGVCVYGDYAFVADDFFGLQVIDVSIPTAPTLAGSYDTPGQARGVCVSGDYAFVADGTYGLQVIDISNPAAPTLTGSYDTASNAADLCVSGDHAYVADGLEGLQVINISNPAVPTLSGSFNTPGSSFGVAVIPWGDVACTGFTGYEYALIDSIVDVPNDQGGQVRIHMTRSIYDFEEETELPIYTYHVWRRVDGPAAVAAVSSYEDNSIAGKKGGAGGPSKVSAKTTTADLPDWPLIEWDGRFFLRSPSEILGDVFPPGTWESVREVPALQQQNYIINTSTLADSSETGIPYAVFVITAHTTTPSIWFTSPMDSGYSVDNIAPGVPEGFAVAYNTGSGNTLTWDPAPEPDFQYYKIYRGTDPDFTPGPATLVDATANTSWNDPEYDGWNVYYKITVVDYAGNESEPASPVTKTGVAELVIPSQFALYQNIPNPFNPTTVIRYDVPAGGGRVTLRVYDVTGRLVRTLVDGEQTAGEKRVTWNGRNARGRQVATGVYFYRMTAPGFEMTKKMVMLQ